MYAKNFRILLALQDKKFITKVTRLLKKHYIMDHTTTIEDLSHKIHKKDFDLIILDYRFNKMRAEDVYQGIELLHPKAIFVVYTKKDNRTNVKNLWKRRALDYINYTDEPREFLNNVHKVVRWGIQKSDTIKLEKAMQAIEGSIEEVRKIIRRWK